VQKLFFFEEINRNFLGERVRGKMPSRGGQLVTGGKSLEWKVVIEEKGNK